MFECGCLRNDYGVQREGSAPPGFERFGRKSAVRGNLANARWLSRTEKDVALLDETLNGHEYSLSFSKPGRKSWTAKLFESEL